MRVDGAVDTEQTVEREGVRDRGAERPDGFADLPLTCAARARGGGGALLWCFALCGRGFEIYVLVAVAVVVVRF